MGRRVLIARPLTKTRDQTSLGLMKLINIQAAKTHLSRLVEQAAAGEEIVIAKAGRPYVKLVPCTPAVSPRKLGGWEGVHIPDDFDNVDADVIRLFEGDGHSAAARTRRKPSPR
jgi:prevent-host-death family protein